MSTSDKAANSPQHAHTVQHNTKLREDVLQRILQRRGRQHIHDTLDPQRTALLVIDMQNAFVEPGRPSAVPVAQHIVPAINQLAAQLRDGGGIVAWVYTTFSTDTLANWNAFFGCVYDLEFSSRVIDNLSAGSDGHRLWPKLDVKSQDLKVSKDRFSAFLPGHCDLEDQLRGRGIETLVITGTLTNVCCESTARDAVMRNFPIIMVSDANAALTDEDHNASLNAIAQTFGDVMTSAEVSSRLCQATAHGAAGTAS